LRLLFTALAIIGLSIKANSQDLINTQPTSAYTTLNPSFMGKDSANLAYITHRNQWPAIQGEYLFTNFGYHHYISKTNGNVGINVQHDLGRNAYENSSLSLNYSQNIKIKKSLLKIGGKASYLQNTSRYYYRGIAQFDQQLGYTSSIEYWGGNGVVVSKFVDFSVGASFYSNGFTVGVATYHILDPINLSDEETFPLTRRITGQVAKSFTGKINGHELEISPYLLYRYQSFFEAVHVGFLGSYRWAVLGVSNRISNDINFIGGVKTKYFNLLYSYDLAISEDAQNFGGAHEMSLQFHPFKRQNKAHKNLLSVKSPFLL